MNNTAVTHEAPQLDTGGLFSLQRLPQLLRGLGATILIAAVSIFLLQGWSDTNDLSRYFLLLGHTALLALMGFSSNLWMGESKGARLLLLLAIASMPANFAIAGGFIYSQFGWDVTQVIYPDYISWRTDNPATAIIATISVLAITVPLCWLSFKVLARRSSGLLAGLYLLTNSALLLPIRDHAAIAIIIPLLSIIVLHTITKARRQDPTLATREGVIARLLLFTPLLILLVRTLWLYEPNNVFFTALSAMSFLLLRQWSLQTPHQQLTLHRLLNGLAIVAAIFTSTCTTVTLAALIPDAGIWLAVTCGILLSIMLFELSMRVIENAKWYRTAAALIVGTTMIVSMFIENSAGLTLCSIAIGILLVVTGYTTQQRIIFISGIMTAILGLVIQLQHIAFNFDLTSWGGMAAMGIIAILSGSIIERNGADIKQYMTRWSDHFRRWDY